MYFLLSLICFTLRPGPPPADGIQPTTEIPEMTEVTFAEKNLKFTTDSGVIGRKRKRDSNSSSVLHVTVDSPVLSTYQTDVEGNTTTYLTLATEHTNRSSDEIFTASEGTSAGESALENHTLAANDDEFSTTASNTSETVSKALDESFKLIQASTIYQNIPTYLIYA